MTANPLVLKEGATANFLEIYKGWNVDERRHFQDVFFQKYFWNTNVLVPLWNANEHKDFARLDAPLDGETGLNPVQESILVESNNTLIELVSVDMEVNLKLRWARMLLLRKETRLEHAQYLLKTFLDNIFINRLATDIVNHAKKKRLSWWQELFK